MAQCTSSHAGYGWKDDSCDVTDPLAVDCLIFHDQTGSYQQGLAGNPNEEVDRVLVARSVGRPTRTNCGACHIKGGGGDAVKHGDMDDTMRLPTARIDVQMSKARLPRRSGRVRQIATSGTEPRHAGRRPMTQTRGQVRWASEPVEIVPPSRKNPRPVRRVFDGLGGACCITDGLGGPSYIRDGLGGPSYGFRNAFLAMFVVVAAWTSLAEAESFHASVFLLDADGRPVIETGMPVSPMQTCAGCHDTAYIASTNTHAAALGTAHAPEPNLPGSQASRASAPVAVELNCFLCHLANPDDEARRSELRGERTAWAATATLARTGVVARSPNGWSYRAEFFTFDGGADARRVDIQRPTAKNCGLCHGQTHFAPGTSSAEPLELDLSLSQTTTATTGQIFSPHRIFASAIDRKGKQRRTRSWDVHAERLLDCIDCHHSINNPAFLGPDTDISPSSKRPDHLRFEPRKIDFPDFAFRPSHRLAVGQPAPTATAEPTGSERLVMRGCADCHDAWAAHAWLPAASAHLSSLSCEACHIPDAPAPAVRSVDWTLPDPDGRPTVQWRGVEAKLPGAKTRATGFRPVLLPREEADGRTRLGPYNLVVGWYWVEGGSQPRPVRGNQLRDALLDGDRYRPELTAVLDTDRDGQVGPDERVLDTPEKVDVVRRRLQAAGISDPEIEVDLKPYAMHHGVVGGSWAVAACDSCHAADSRLGETVVLASYLPGNVRPDAADAAAAGLSGRFETTDTGQYVYRPSAGRTWLYVPGYSRWMWIDMLGGIALLGVTLAIAVHSAARLGTARLGTARRRTTDVSDSKREDRGA